MNPKYIIALFLICPLLVFAQNKSIIQAEYFWDNDPGVGNGVAFTAVDGALDEAVEALINGNVSIPANGSHTFNIRVKDWSSSWGPVFSVVVTALPSVTEQREITVSEAEYFWDTDPGEGNATPMLAFDGNFDEAFEEVMAQAPGTLLEGIHVLHVRMREPQNNWSNTFNVVVSILEPVTDQREIYVAAGEYWFDADPGEGNGTPVVAMDGSFNAVVEGIIGGEIPSPVTAGIHVLWIRAKEPQGGWGPAFGIVVNMDISIGTFTTDIIGQNNICSGNDQLGVTYNCIAATGSTYTWSITGGIIISGQGTPSITVNWNTAATHTLTLEQCINANCQTDALDVNIYNASDITNNVTICEGQSYFAGGALQTTAGVYQDNYTTIYGCDSTVVTILSVLDNITVNTNAHICQGESIVLGGSPRTTAGTYVDEYTAAGGCDSLVYTTLFVHPTYNQSFDVEICEGQSYFAGGANQTTEGFYTDVFNSIFGCDSIVVTHLIVNETINSNQFVDICEGESYFAGGADQTESGVYVDNLSGDCSETLTTYLTVHPTYSSQQQVSICNGESYFAGGALQTQGGTYVDAYQTAFGCDSTVTTILSVGDVINNDQYIDICAGESYFAGGALQTQSGIYVDLVGNEGCVETLTTYLTVHDPVESTQNIQLCEGQTYFTGGALQSQPGTYVDLFETVNGCDSLVTTNLSFTDGFNNTVNLTICAGDSVFLEGEWQDQPGAFTDLFESTGGCDSIVVTLLSLTNGFNETATAAICEGESIMLGGAMQTQAGTYTDIFTSSSGCDSTVTTTLVVHPVYDITTTATICEGDSIFLGGAWQQNAGIYFDILQSGSGCDSTVTTTLNVLFAPAQPNIIDNLLGTPALDINADSTTWYLDSELCAPAVVTLPGNSIPITDYCTGIFWFISAQAFQGGCSSPMSDTTLITIWSIEEHSQTLIFDLYPNPTIESLTLSAVSLPTSATIMIYDAMGKTVMQTNGNGQSKMLFDVEALSAGVYWIRLTDGNRSAVKPFTKE